MNLVQKLSTGVAGSALALTLAFTPVAAQEVQVIDAGNGAAGLVAAVVDANVVLNDVLNDNNVDVAVVELNNSLNNLRALNNVLNNSPILNNNNVLNDLTVQNINVLTDFQIDVLRNADINLDDVVGVAILSGGDFIVFTN